jgi:uncharacterized protein involved in type VI secretion and phage assembly
MADEFTQNDKRLRIETALNQVEEGDPLLLVKIHGVEGISRPFVYDITLFRHKSKPQIWPRDLINTMAKVSIKIAEREILKAPVLHDIRIDTEVKFSYVSRYGMFESITFQGINDDDFQVYSARLVPPLKLMDRQVAFRVFERMTIPRIIDVFAIDCPGLVINPKLLEDETFPELEYCVQFQETTFNFLSRLMAQAGIWYYFSHSRAPWTITMILGRSKMTFGRCMVTEGSMQGLLLDEMYVAAGKDKPSALTVSDWQHVFSPVPRYHRAGNFNPLKPTDRIDGHAAIDAPHDLLAPFGPMSKKQRVPPGPLDTNRVESFPVNAANNAQAKWIAESRRDASASQVISATGTTRNIAFSAGHLFGMNLGSGPKPIEQGDPDIILKGNSLGLYEMTARPKRDYLLTYLDFLTYEGSYSAKGFFGTLFDTIYDTFDPDSSTGLGDAITATTAAGLNNYLQNELPYLMQGEWFPEAKPGQAYFFPYVLGGGMGAITAFLPTIKKALVDLMKQSPNDYSVSFQAVPIHSDSVPPPGSLPLPVGTKPVAHGPHSAVVVGPDGATPKGQDVYADILGRVRVRFPWDPGRRDSFDMPESYGDPYANADVTCWVRCSEGWAGRRYGTQFLPRIGEEVLVAFIDGDPDRPIIIGRAYNADRGPTNLPFPHSQDAYKKNLTPDDLLNATGLNHFPRSGIKTRSTPSTDPSGGDTKNGFHLLRFDDTAGKEQLLLRSQNRMDMTVLGVKYESIGSDYHLTIGGIDANGQAGGDHIVKIFGDYHHHVGDGGASNGGNYFESVEKNLSLAVKKDIMISGKGGLIADLADVVSFDGSSIVLTATKKITLKVGGSWIVITPAGVFSNGPIVGDKSGGQPDGRTSVVTTDGPDPIPADRGDT